MKRPFLPALVICPLKCASNSLIVVPEAGTWARISAAVSAVGKGAVSVGDGVARKIIS